VPDDLVHEERGVQPLALQPPLHVGQRHDHRVHGAGRDRGADLLEAGRPLVSPLVRSADVHH
jgi:tRNA U54 and U55 pseudouridine synthase Pus10